MDPIKNTPKDHFGLDQEINLKEELRKYSSFWPWFVVGITLAIFASFLYLRYTPLTFQTIAKVRILDEKESLELPSASSLFSQSKINLENEIEGIKSYPILEEVSNRLNLHANLYAVGHIKSSRLTQFPFDFELKPSTGSSEQTGTYLIEFTSSGLEVFKTKLDSLYQFDAFQTKGISHDLPFDIVWDESAASRDVNESYRLELTPVSMSVNLLKKRLSISGVGKKSEIISIGLVHHNREYSENVVNTLIEVYNQDGVDDRQLVHKRTIDFINERFITLGYELDSIEMDKESFKLENNLVDISTDATISLESRSKSDEELFEINNQILLAELLLESSSTEHEYSLIPSNIGLEDLSINLLISEYNKFILEYNKLIQSGGGE
ncbi:hypothetical protein N9V23_02850 [Flavobacteriales bacterium]|nr:hypothetical protein [Flavobacteriales bacterium]